MGNQSAAPTANQEPAKSCRSSGGCPLTGPSRTTTRTKPRRRRPPEGTRPSRRSLPPSPGAALQKNTKKELRSSLCPLEFAALAQEPAASCDPGTRTPGGHKLRFSVTEHFPWSHFTEISGVLPPLHWISADCDDARQMLIACVKGHVCFQGSFTCITSSSLRGRCCF
ncbi:hypothetical protein fugu_002289 [Takifugu bimaculatus]|uniref:Uncharacterized protein n=1 Tax=Takifugu bimaculatus TaxID=433685 RepID=A0A4Z2BP95_9TELE|nr:hypothetical protein fugu_002289 [Takifugu bimaculatus]